MSTMTTDRTRHFPVDSWYGDIIRSFRSKYFFNIETTLPPTRIRTRFITCGSTRPLKRHFDMFDVWFVDQKLWKQKLVFNVLNNRDALKSENTINMVDESTRKTLSSIPLMQTKAGPRDKELWVNRLKEEYQALIKVTITSGYTYTHLDSIISWLHTLFLNLLKDFAIK